jgi:hypothetical protein
MHAISLSTSEQAGLTISTYYKLAVIIHILPAVPHSISRRHSSAANKVYGS